MRGKVHGKVSDKWIVDSRAVKYGILSNNRCSKLHAVIDCLFFLLAKIPCLIDRRLVRHSSKENGHARWI